MTLPNGSGNKPATPDPPISQAITFDFSAVDDFQRSQALATAYAALDPSPERELLAQMISADRRGELIAKAVIDAAASKAAELGPTENPTQAHGVELAAFLAKDLADPDWVVPRLLERRDRLIVTGPEGGGKSTLLRQIAVQLASGIHPFNGDTFPPLRVLLLDLENSQRQVYRALRPLHVAAGEHYAGGLILSVRGEGLDLTQGDGAVLEAEADAARPDVIIVGPLYKLVAGDPTEEGPARLASNWLDKLRNKHDCAIITEAHSPHASNGKTRPTRPYGASLWMRWPEFGLHLADTGMVSHWRGPRDERDWPAALQRGGDWPWSPVTRPRDLLWARISDLCAAAGEQLSYRDLAQLTGSSYGAVKRAIDENKAAWEALEGGE